jgi:hypothetical protein
LRAFLVGLLAFALVTQAAAAAMQAPSSPRSTKAATARQTLTLDEQLERKVAALRKHRATVRFFETHRSLFGSAEHRTDATASLAYAKRRVQQLTKSVEALRTKVHRRDDRREARLAPKAAICAVFADRCQEAVAVAWCESHLSTTAQNGQYLGMFQMGSYERQLFGHGATAHAQAVAAHRYFVRSGRDWSPWSCRWAAA